MCRNTISAQTRITLLESVSMTDLIDPMLLQILVCPVTKAPLEYDAKAHELISPKAGLAFPVRNGIPILLIKEARSIS